MSSVGAVCLRVTQVVITHAPVRSSSEAEQTMSEVYETDKERCEREAREQWWEDEGYVDGRNHVTDGALAGVGGVTVYDYRKSEDR
jgi:hypothetical protein